MNNLFELENKYLTAKIKYYQGDPIMTDPEFDVLEAHLKEKGSKVINQVGAKIKDFDFTHPTPMLSLDKIQTEANDDGSVNYMTEDFQKWYAKRLAIVGKTKLFTSPKFDGNAINIIYIGRELANVVTRGDGAMGKDVTEKLRSQLPKKLNFANNIKISEDDVVEIRCEVVIEKELFAKKYADKFANERNYVAGVLGNDKMDVVKCGELTVMPIHVLLNGEHLSPLVLENHKELAENMHFRTFYPENYEAEYDYYVELRKKFHTLLDGIVISFPDKYREELGENDHDPEWSVAIKFIPEEVTTTVIGIEWFIGKTGEFTPVIQLEPVQLAGTNVQRASGYNHGYIIENKIGKGAIVSIAKAGDIIPEVQSVVVPSDVQFGVNPKCPHCNSDIEIEGVHLMCNNTKCPGRVAKQLSSNGKKIGIKGIGPKTFEKFANDFEDLVELMVWVKTDGNTPEINNYDIEYQSRSHAVFLKSFDKIKTLTYGEVIVMLSYNNVGLKLANQVANMYNGADADFSGHDKSIIEMFKDDSIKDRVMRKVETLVNIGIVVELPKEQVITSDTLLVCMTGKTTPFGYKTKKEFAGLFGDKLVEVSATKCKYLITDDINSKSGKMEKARKNDDITILTYADFATKFE